MNFHHFVIYLLIVLFAIGVSGCGSSSKSSPASVEDGGIHEEPALSGEVFIAECSGLNGSDFPCYWRYQYDNALCSVNRPCDKLVIYYSGGGMVCDDGVDDPEHQSSQVLAQYAGDSYIAVCANIFLDKYQTSFSSEAERIDRIQMSVTQSNVIKQLWTGRDLLISGVSHGATAPAVTMAKTDYDEGSHWQGTRTTGVCLLDGVYDVQAANSYFLNYPLQCAPIRQSVICDRYFAGDCSAVNDANADYAGDVIVNIPADRYALKNWHLVECGSALPGCQGDADWIPADPIAKVCDTINASPVHACQLGSLPNEGHLSCSTHSGSTMCRTWFNGLPE